MYIFYLKYIVELLRAPLYNFFFCIIFFPGISKKKYARTGTVIFIFGKRLRAYFFFEIPGKKIMQKKKL